MKAALRDSRSMPTVAVIAATAAADRARVSSNTNSVRWAAAKTPAAVSRTNISNVSSARRHDNGSEWSGSGNRFMFSHSSVFMFSRNRTGDKSGVSRILKGSVIETR